MSLRESQHRALQMNHTPQFMTVAGWRAALGLLPIPLRENPTNGERYLLLNGASGNFCLDFVGGTDRSSQRDAAWSCDVGHYITCINDSVIVNRWDRSAPEEKYTRGSVISRLHEFHRHLEKTAPDRSRSVVAHVLRVFRQIRAAVAEHHGGILSLRILLHLLASVADRKDRLIETDLEFWGLTPEVTAASDAVAPATWHSLHNDLAGVGGYDVGRPDFELILRHASGAIFQDAHLEAGGSPTLWLPGLEQPLTIDSRATPTGTGVYFTPSALARTLAEEATRNIEESDDRHLVLFDPACGSGELLKECLRLLKIKKHRGPLKVVGWDKSAASIDMARFVLSYEKNVWPTHQVQIELSLQDSLLAEKWQDADIIVMNPPFKSWQLMDKEEKEAATYMLGPSSRPNLAVVFARRALDAMRDAGILAMIIPNSFLEADSAEGVREALALSLKPQLIARLGSQSIFARALVDAGMYVGTRKPGQGQSATILWVDSKPGSLTRALRGLRTWRSERAGPLNGEGFSIYTRKDIGTTGTPWIARGFEAWNSYETLRSGKAMIVASDVFDIRQGVRLGNDVFVVTSAYADQLPRRERRFFRPAVMNPSIADGKLSDAYYVFYPYSSGLPPTNTEADLERHVPTYYVDHLLKAKSALKDRRTLKRQTELKWWDLLWHRSWQAERDPKISSKYFGSRHSFAFDRTGDFVVVVGNAWLLKKGVVQHGITEREIYLAFLAYLNSGVADSIIQYLSVQVSGGQWDLSRRYLSGLLVPNLSKLTPVAISTLIQAGIAICEGQMEKWIELDDVVVSAISSVK